MIRSALVLLGIILLIALSIGFLGDHGAASLNWMHYRVDTTATATVIIIGFMAFCAVAFWNFVLWLARSPQRSERARAEHRRRQGEEALTRGFMAIASGEGAEARRLAVKALDLHDNGVLVRILSALAAEESGDVTATRAAYTAMLSVPELRLAGLKGLTQLALSQGDRVEATRLAAEAYNQARPAMWAFRTLFEARLEAGEWAEALDLAEGALTRKLISPLFAERARAALLTASAAKLENEADAQMREQALDYALRAAKQQSAFTPAPVIAARLLLRAGKVGRAEDVLEAAWGAHPHPAIMIAYRDLVNDETPRDRARRLHGLVDRNPKHRESRLLQLERATLSGVEADISAAMVALEPDLGEEVVTRRVCGLMAKASSALHDYDTARTWIARGGLARPEANWSDIDAEGKAFAYSDADWASLVLGFAETADLTHPRLERGDKGLPELPELPTRFVPSMPFIKAPARSTRGRIEPAPQADDPDGFDDAITGHDLEAPPIEVVKPKAVRRKKTGE